MVVSLANTTITAGVAVGTYNILLSSFIASLLVARTECFHGVVDGADSLRVANAQITKAHHTALTLVLTLMLVGEMRKRIKARIDRRLLVPIPNLRTGLGVLQAFQPPRPFTLAGVCADWGESYDHEYFSACTFGAVGE